MNKQQLASAVAERTKLTKAQAAIVINEIGPIIANAVKAGEIVKLPGLGRFKIKTRKARVTQNPSTGAEMHIKEAQLVAFKPEQARNGNTPANSD